MSKKYKKGWKCPVCSAVMSPEERVCVNCKGLPQVVYIPYVSPQPDTGNKLIVTHYACQFPDNIIYK